MDLNERSVADLTRTCRSAFNRCLTHHGLQKNQWAENRCADFTLWADGVGALAASRASLDSRFQSQPSELTLVKGTLVMLQDFLDQCVHCAESGALIDEAIENVDSALENLVLLAVAIRRTGRRSRLEKADRKFDPEDHSELALLLKIWCLYMLGANKPDEVLARLKDMSTDGRVMELKSTELSSPQERLLQTNLRRRNRFLQAQRHSEGLKSLQWGERGSIHDRLERSGDDTERSTKEEQVDMANQQSGHELGSTFPVEPTISGTSASIPESKLNAQRVKRKSSQVAMTTITTLAAAVRYPRPPKAQEGLAMFKCPCCCQTLPVEVALDGTRWKKHLSEDISPYTCLLEDCPTPFATYVTESDWENHVKNKHPPRRLCPFCQDMSTIFLSMEAFLEHVQVEHAETVSESLMMAVMSHSGVVTIGVTHCPLCDSTGPESDPEFIRHVLNCIHDFSLRSLPWMGQPPCQSRYVGTYNVESVKCESMFQWLADLELGEMSRLQLSQWDNAQISQEGKVAEYFENNDYFDLEATQDSLEALERSSKSFSQQEDDLDDDNYDDDIKFLQWIQLAIPDINRLLHEFRTTRSTLSSREAEIKHIGSQHEQALMHKDFYIEALQAQMQKSAYKSAEESAKLKHTITELRLKLKNLQENQIKGRPSSGKSISPLKNEEEHTELLQSSQSTILDLNTPPPEYGMTYSTPSSGGAEGPATVSKPDKSSEPGSGKSISPSENDEEHIERLQWINSAIPNIERLLHAYGITHSTLSSGGDEGKATVPKLDKSSEPGSGKSISPSENDEEHVNLLQRLKSSMPDINRLLHEFRTTHSTLSSREAEMKHIRSQHEQALMHKDFYIEALQAQMQKSAYESAEESAKLKDTINELRFELHNIQENQNNLEDDLVIDQKL